MAGWHHWLDGHESEWTWGGQGGLACCDSWGRKELDMTEWLDWLNLLMWSILENAPYDFEKNLYSEFFLAVMSWKYQLNQTVLLFHLGSLLLYWFSVWKICPLVSVGFKVAYYYCIPLNFSLHVFSIHFIYLGAPILDAHVNKCNILFPYLSLCHDRMFSLWTLFLSQFVWYNYRYSHFLATSICMIYLFRSPHFQSVCVLYPKMILL